MLLLLILVIFVAGIVLAVKLNNKAMVEIKKEIDAAMSALIAENNITVSKSIDVESYQNNLPNATTYTKFIVDDENKKFVIFNYDKILRKQQFTCVNYSDLLNFNLFEDGEQQLQGRGAMSAVGALTFGIAGAVVGSVAGDRKVKNKCRELSVRIQINDLDNPLISIGCVSNCDKNNIFYTKGRQTADNIIATLTYIENNK